jgi:hypothetical protein
MNDWFINKHARGPLSYSSDSNLAISRDVLPSISEMEESDLKLTLKKQYSLVSNESERQSIEERV